MEHFGHQNGEIHRNPNVETTCESVYQSVGYDSGICLSNYRSTEGGSSVLSRDSDGLVDGLSTLQLETDAPDGARAETGNCVKPTSSGFVSVVQPGCTEAKDTGMRSSSFEDQIFEQDEEGDTLLHLAIIKPDISVAIRMIEMTRISEYLDIQNKAYMHTPLHLAVITSQPPIVRALLISGASVTSRDRNGNTALHLACKQGDLECVKQLTMPLNEMENRFLWDRGTLPCAIKPMQSDDVNLMNYEGESSIHLALFSGTNAGYDIFDYLVSHCSANINIKDGKCGYTVMHQAVKSKDVELVQFLLRYRQLAINELCYSGNTALDIAISLNLPQLEMVLRMAGGVCTESSDSPDMSDDNEVDEFDDLMIGGLRINA